MRNLKYLSFILLFSVAPAFGSLARERDLIVSIGNLCEHIGTYQTNAEGDKNFCQLNPIFSLALDYPINEKLSLLPQAAISLPKKSRDKSITKTTFSTLINIVYRPHELKLSYKLGTGLFFTRMSGRGGTVVLNNGDNLEVFQLPGKVMTASNLIVNAGLNYQFHPQVSMDLYSYIFNLEDKLERSYSLGLNINYHFGERLWNR